MSIEVGFHYTTRAEHTALRGVKSDALQFHDDKDGRVSLYLPPHVAEHTAAAFNRAMQAVPDRDGWTYTAKSGVWHISYQHAAGYHAQHDEVTGDEDPGFYFTCGDTLLDCMDVIDAIEDEEGCDICNHLVGSDALTQIEDSLYCDDCARTESERQAGMAEMAGDDRAHAMMDGVVHDGYPAIARAKGE
jgi:hypothetical protein